MATRFAGDPMETPQLDFLPTVIGILQRLQATSVERGQANLAVLLDLAKMEAEDVLRTANMDADARSALRQSSSVASSV